MGLKSLATVVVIAVTAVLPLPSGAQAERHETAVMDPAGDVRSWLSPDAPPVSYPKADITHAGVIYGHSFFRLSLKTVQYQDPAEWEFLDGPMWGLDQNGDGKDDFQVGYDADRGTVSAFRLSDSTFACQEPLHWNPELGFFVDLHVYCMDTPPPRSLRMYAQFDHEGDSRAQYVRDRAPDTGFSAAVAPPPPPPPPPPSEPNLSVVRVRVNPPGPDARSLNGEYIVLHNDGPETINLKSWRIRSGSRRWATLPWYTLHIGDTVRVHVGAGRRQPGKLYLGRSQPFWPNAGLRARVYDDNGVLRDDYKR